MGCRAAIVVGEGWYVYIVECVDGTLYTGVAKDPQKRVAEHNEGNGAKYTRGRLPVGLVYVERVGERGAALKREFEIKRMSRKRKRELRECGADREE